MRIKKVNNNKNLIIFHFLLIHKVTIVFSMKVSTEHKMKIISNFYKLVQNMIVCLNKQDKWLNQQLNLENLKVKIMFL